MKILALIPARGGSKGVPGKNKKLLNGKPLIVYSIEAALDAGNLAEVLVSTDDETIAGISRAADAKVPFLRPAELATDASPTIDTVLHAVEYYEQTGKVFDAVCLLQPTCPLRTAADITESIGAFVKSGADSLISVKVVPHNYNPHWVFEEKADSPFLKIATGEQEIISRRQELPKAYHRDGSIYIIRTDILKKTRSLYGEKIAWYESKNPQHVNIDTLEDWAEAERILVSL